MASQRKVQRYANAPYDLIRSGWSLIDTCACPLWGCHVDCKSDIVPVISPNEIVHYLTLTSQCSGGHIRSWEGAEELTCGYKEDYPTLTNQCGGGHIRSWEGAEELTCGYNPFFNYKSVPLHPPNF